MRKYALIVDDVEINRDLLSDILSFDFDILNAGDGIEALKLLEEKLSDIAIVMLDLVMPHMSGIEVLKIMNQKGWINDIPVIIISSDNAVETEQQCFDLGVVDFVAKPFRKNIVERRALNAAQLYQYKNHLERKVAEQTEELIQKNNQLIDLNNSIIVNIADVVEARSLESGLHVKRVMEFTRLIANKLAEDFPEYCLDKEKIELITKASALHDVGKIMIKDSVLLKPGRLTFEEFEYMKTHTTLGCDVIEKLSKKWDKETYQFSYDICKYHHEKYDGRGYPDGLVGDEIPISAQIVSICDCYDALTSERCYKKAFPLDVAHDMIKNGECGKFSDKILSCFVKCKDDMEKLAINLK